MAYKVLFFLDNNRGGDSMKEIGEYLKETRINHGVSIDEAAEDLKMTPKEIENMEEGNTRAFKDLYHLKELVREYAKYLGLDLEKVSDEFNDFLFEKTSRISLDDIKEARKRKQEEEKKVSSPYTKIPPQKVNFAPVVLAFLIAILVLLVIYLIFRSLDTDEVRNTELMGRDGCYEFAYQVDRY